MPKNNVIIVGAGPAGIAAAIQLKRSGLNPIVFEKKCLGGLLNNANLVENYPGFPGGITGRKLVELFKQQFESFGIDIKFEKVETVDYKNRLFLVQTESNKYESQAVIIASGTKPKQTIEFEISEKIKNRIFYEVVELLDLKQKDIAIIGAGDAAFDYALNLGRNNNVTILNRGEKISCLPLLFDRAKTSKSIKYITKTQVVEIAEDSTNRLLLKCRNDNSDIDIFADYVILAIGRKVQIGFMTDNIMKYKKDLEKREILHFVGDVNGQIYRQTSIAVGEAVMAAMKIVYRLNNFRDNLL